MKLSRRSWNNVMILGIILFIVILNTPILIQTYLLDQEDSPYPSLLDREQDVYRLDFSDWSLRRDRVVWISSRELTISALEVVQRWKALEGTEIDDTTFTQLKKTLPSPQSIEVWYLDVEEPQRVTYYRTPQFWLMKNWQQNWIAISAEDEYLFPF